MDAKVSDLVPPFEGRMWYNMNSIYQGRAGVGRTHTTFNHERVELSMARWSIPQKRCRGCRELLPATTEFFRETKRTTDGLNPRCRECQRHDTFMRKFPTATEADWVALNISAIPVAEADTLIAQGLKRCAECKSIRHLDEFPTTNKKNKDICRPCIAAKKIVRSFVCSKCGERKHKSDFSYTHDKTRSQYCKSCRSNWYKEYRKNNPQLTRLNNAARSARERNLPNDYTAKDWLRALEYFNDSCAVCGRLLIDPLGNNLSAMDHWIPLASPDCPGTVPTNIVPLCGKSGGCNSNKKHRNALEWLIQRYGEYKAAEINARIQAYFEFIASQESER